MDRQEPSERQPAIVETLTDGDAHRSKLRPRDRVGRYTIMEPVGSGAMGIVYLANDPELDRRVAIKVMHRDSRRPELASKRLLREARAMARLAHANVVTVHDVGTHDGHVFVAMEFVRGMDLRKWMDPGRPWRDTTEVMLQAARGLAAAHAAGVVHRDFKPDNVMVDRRGRACVTDFGLAASGTAPATLFESTEPLPLHQPVAADDDGLLTRTKGLLGTPGYLAPEQFEGRPADELTDQFSFCVSMWEALFGERPFVGRTVAELAIEVMRGEVRMPRDDRRVPARLRRIAQQGLARDRGKRWPSMAALVDALERVLGRRRTLTRWSVAVAVVAASTATAAYLGTRDRAAPCDAGPRLAAVWNADVRARVHEAIAAATPEAAEDLERRIDERAGAWTVAWEQAYRSVCAARDEWSDSLRDRAGHCLDRRLDELRAAVDAVARVDAERASKAIDVFDGMARPEPCADRDALLTEVGAPADPATAEQVESMRTVLADLRAREHAGEIQGIEDELATLVESARHTAHPPLVAEVLLQYGRVLGAAGKIGPDQAALEEAFYTATQAQDLHVALAAATALATAVGARAGRPNDGMTWARHARALLGALPPDPIARARVDWVFADLHTDRNELVEARALVESAMAAYDAAGMQREVADGHFTLGRLAMNGGDLETAVREIEAAREITSTVLGPHHPDSAGPIIGLGMVELRRGHPERSAELMREALAIYEDVYGPEHPYVAGTLHNLGSIEHARNRHAEARVVLERTLALRERLLGAEHPDVAATLGLLGSVYEELGDLPAARRVNERALAIFVAIYGERHPRVADVLTNLGTLAVDAGDPHRAIETLERALSLRRETQGAEHADVALVLADLAHAHRAKGDLAAARTHAEQAAAMYEATLGSDHERTVHARELVAELAAGE